MVLTTYERSCQLYWNFRGDRKSSFQLYSHTAPDQAYAIVFYLAIFPVRKDSLWRLFPASSRFECQTMQVERQNWEKKCVLRFCRLWRDQASDADTDLYEKRIVSVCSWCHIRFLAIGWTQKQLLVILKNPFISICLFGTLLIVQFPSINPKCCSDRI